MRSVLIGMDSEKKIEKDIRLPRGKSTVDDQESVSVTIYNSNMGLVKDIRNISIPTGHSELQFMGVAEKINPATVHIKSITEPNALGVVEQSFEYDLLNPNKLLDKYVGKEITLVIRRMDGNSEHLVTKRATLLSNNDGQVWRIGGEIVINPANISEIRFDELPPDLIARPALVWSLQNEGRDRHSIEVSYITGDLSWLADYILVVNPDDTRADLNGWVTIVNNSGATYRNSELKLVAGEVHREQRDGRRMMIASTKALATEQFQEDSFFEYHIYSLQRRTTLKDRQTKQISLLSATDFVISKELVLNGQPHYIRSSGPPGEAIRQNVGVSLSFRNGVESSLGIPLPMGTMRVYKADRSGSLQFIGEDRVEHTPKDEILLVNVGNAFDVVADRRMIDFKQSGRSVYECEHEIRIRNHKKEAITVTVNEPIGGQWEMLSSSYPVERTAAFAARFKVPIEKDGESVLNYRVRII